METAIVLKQDNIKKRAGRPTKADYDLRVKEVVKMLLNGRPRHVIIEDVVQTYGLRESSVNNMITAGYKYIRENHAIDREGIVATHLELYYDIYTQAKALGDSRSAITALNSIEKLLKLTQDTAINNNNLNLNLKDLTLNELKDLIKPIN